MDIITGFALVGGIVLVALVVCLLIEYRAWRHRHRLLTANWVSEASQVANED